MERHAAKLWPPGSSSKVLLALTICFAALAGAPGCGGSDPLVPAHSASFSPVRGVGDNGAPVNKIQWIRRANGGQPIPSASDPGLTIQFSDTETTVENDVVTGIVNGTIQQDGAAIGHESVRTLQHLTPGASPATVGEEDDRTTVTVSQSGLQMTQDQSLKDVYTPPLSIFDNDDLDSMPVGTAGSFTSQAVVTGAVSATATGQPPQMQTVSEFFSLSVTWTIMDKLATFQVLGQDYANVVVLQLTSSGTNTSTGTTSTVSGTSWYAKGIGLIRSEQTGTNLDVAGKLILELVSTNLVP